MPNFRATALPVALLLLSATALWSKPAAPRQAADTRTYTITPEMEGGALRSLRVEIRLKGDADGETLLLLPATNNPRDSNPLETLSDFSVTNAQISSPEPWLRKLTHAPGAPLVLTYRVTQQSEMRFSTIVRPDFFSANGQRIFPGVEGRDDFHFKFGWGPVPAGWSVASDLEHQKRAQTPALDIANSFFTGGSGSGIVIEERKLGKGRFRIALPTDVGLETRPFADLVVRTAEGANELWQDRSSEYLVSVTTVKMPRGIVNSGFGMTDSYALFVTPNPDLFALKSTITHEYLHTWIGKRFGETWPDWFGEGFTDYYTKLVNLRSGIYTPEEFVRSWNEALLNYASSPVRLAPDADVVAKDAKGDPDATRINYTRGSMMAALFDYRIRSASKGKRSLTDVLRLVKADHEKKRGRSDAAAQLVHRARQLAGADLQPDIERHLTRGEALVLPQDLFGRCATIASVKIARFERGYEIGADDKVKDVDPKSAAYAAGLRNGMTYVKRESGKPGDSRVEFVLRVKDGDQERLIRYLPAGAEMLDVQQVQLTPALSASGAQACTRLMSGASS